MGSSSRAAMMAAALLATYMLVALTSFARADYRSAVSVQVLGGQQDLLSLDDYSAQSASSRSAADPTFMHGPGGPHSPRPGTHAFCNGRVRVTVNTSDLLGHLAHHQCGHGEYQHPDSASSLPSQQQQGGLGLRSVCTTGWTGRGYEVNLEEFQAFSGDGSRTAGSEPRPLEKEYSLWKSRDTAAGQLDSWSSSGTPQEYQAFGGGSSTASEPLEKEYSLWGNRDTGPDQVDSWSSSGTPQDTGDGAAADAWSSGKNAVRNGWGVDRDSLLWAATLGHWRRDHRRSEKACDAWVEVPTGTGDKVLLCARCELEEGSAGAPAPAPKPHGRGHGHGASSSSRPLGRQGGDAYAQLEKVNVKIKIKIKIEVRVFRRGPH